MKQERPPRDALGRWLQSVGAAEAFSALADDVAGAAVFAVDAERRVLWWSPGAERLLGFAAAEVVGEHCLKSNRCQSCIQGCGIERFGQVADVPLTLVDARGQEVRVRKTARAFFDASGAFAGGVEVLLPDLEAPGEGAPRPPDEEDFHGLRTRDPGMRKALELVRRVAETEAPVLIRGESGTGKELVARGLHLESRRAGRPFLAVNCAALVPTLLESELFGHVKGAFTGATRDRPGLLERADGGTFFLDEVGELPLELQPKLLRVLQDQAVVPVGGERARRVDVRIVSATHRSLRAEVAAGRFREDLMYRLRVVPLFLPPLRERTRDVEALLWHFLAAKNQAGPRRLREVAPEAMRALLDHPWPGNVRELENVVEYAWAVGVGSRLELADLPPEFREGAGGEPRWAPRRARSEAGSEREEIERALAEAGGHPGQAARRLGMSRTTFWRRRKKYGL